MKRGKDQRDMGERKESSDTWGDISVPYIHSSLSIGLMPRGESFRSDIGGATALDRQVSRPAVGTKEGQGGSRTILVELRGCDEKVVVVETTTEEGRKQRKNQDLFNVNRPGYILQGIYLVKIIEAKCANRDGRAQQPSRMFAKCTKRLRFTVLGFGNISNRASSNVCTSKSCIFAT